MEKQKLVVICGPTATGKTDLAVQVAQAFSGEVVSADSMQVYRGMDIGTAKPSHAEQGGVPHHMLGIVDAGSDYGAALYQQQARGIIADIADRGNLPILCGGTGLYISAVVYPLDFSDTDADEEYREELRVFAEAHGREALHARLAEADPAGAAQIHPNNVRRVIRALEKARQGVPAEKADQRLFGGESLYDTAWVGLTMDRAELYRRIEERVDAMMVHGLADEAAGLASLCGREAPAFQAIGYKELLEYIDGRVTLPEAVTQIKTGTRNYAKRQLTWFRREAGIRWFDVGGQPSREQLFEDVSSFIRSTLHIL